MISVIDIFCRAAPSFSLPQQSIMSSRLASIVARAKLDGEVCGRRRPLSSQRPRFARSERAKFKTYDVGGATANKGVD